jgi:hypothetical protein
LRHFNPAKSAAGDQRHRVSQAIAGDDELDLGKACGKASGTLVAWNAAAADLFGDYALVPQQRRNVP